MVAITDCPSSHATEARPLTGVAPQLETTQEVRLFLLPFGGTADGLPSAEELVGLHSAYERSMPHNYGGVTTVVCRYGIATNVGVPAETPE